MESQAAPKIIDVENLVPIVKDEKPTENPVCGCRGQLPADLLRSLMEL